MSQDENAGAKGRSPRRLWRRWEEIQVTKTATAWSWAAVAGLTMILGFTWGGWVTAGTAEMLAVRRVDDALLQRLGPICAAQFKQGAGQGQKIQELEQMDNWKRGEYIEKHGWATMPGEEKPDGRVATECARLLLSGTK